MIRVATVVAVVLLWGCGGSEEAASDPPDTDATEDAPEDGAGDDGDPDGSDVSGQDGSDDEQGIADTADGNEAFGNVTLNLEPILEIAWDPIDAADRYQISVDGVDVARTAGPVHILHEESGEVSVEALDPEGEALGPATVDITDSERLVVRWDENAIPFGFIGLVFDGGHRHGSASSPSVITQPPDEIERVLFGEMLEIDEGEGDEASFSGFSSPFEIERGEIIEHRPFIELPLPELP